MYVSWAQCRQQVTSYGRAVFKKYTSLAEAKSALDTYMRLFRTSCYASQTEKHSPIPHLVPTPGDLSNIDVCVVVFVVIVAKCISFYLF